jgi:LuxR family maltose regulon positive regulatory protein
LLAQGAAVAWLTADPADTPSRLLQGLVLAVRVACGRPGFGQALTSDMAVLEGVTAWLAEVAQTGADVVLVVDEADKLSEAGFALLIYLLGNLPPNLRMVVAARHGLDKAAGDMVAYGQAALVTMETLRFRSEETAELIAARLHDRLDEAADLHEVTEGWPLGLQMILSARERAGSAGVPLGQEREKLLAGLLANLPPQDLDFLVRISVTDRINPDLCHALTGSADAAATLERLATETPFFAVSDGNDWCRLHNLARDALRARFALLPKPDQAELHRRAGEWLDIFGLHEEAARHAYAAGDDLTAYRLAERCAYDAAAQGHIDKVLQWIAIIPAAEQEKLPRLRLAAAWALAYGERHEEAEKLVARILAGGGADRKMQYECALIASGAAFSADRPDLFAEQFRPWAGMQDIDSARLRQIHANRLSLLALLQGDAAQARRFQQTLTQSDADKSHAYAVRCGQYVVALSYITEGQVRLAEEVLRPAVRQVDAELGRRQPLSCILAGLLSDCLYEQDRQEEAAALLSGRLDAIERGATPETVLISCRTAARIALAEGNEHRAMDLLESLAAAARARRLPRLLIASLAEQVRLHAGRARVETSRALMRRIDEAVAGAGDHWGGSEVMLQGIAQAYAWLAEEDWPAMRDTLRQVAPLVETLRQERRRIEVMALTALADERLGLNGMPRLREAITLAEAYGLKRVFIDSCPQVAAWVAKESGASAPTAVVAAEPAAAASTVLTPKERQVLLGLAGNLSNKEIALDLGMGAETVKWHAKNLFAKLDAGTRRQAVRRAELLGLLRQ